MGKIEISNKLIARAKERQKMLKDRGIRKNLFECASDIHNEEAFNTMSSLFIKQVGLEKIKKRGQDFDFFGGFS